MSVYLVILVLIILFRFEAEIVDLAKKVEGCSVES